jgi:hypothetical protein
LVWKQANVEEKEEEDKKEEEEEDVNRKYRM